MRPLNDTQAAVRFVQPKGIVVFPAVFQRVTLTVGIVADYDAAVDDAGAEGDCGAQIGKSVTGEVAEICVPDGHSGIKRCDLVSRHGFHLLRIAAERYARIFWEIDFKASVPVRYLGFFQIVEPLFHLRRPHIGHIITAAGRDLLCFWICQKADRCRGADERRGQNDPERGLLIVHHRLYPSLYSHLAESEGTRRNAAAADAAGYKRMRIIGSLLIAHFPDDSFVAGKLDIPAQQDIAEP